MGSGCLPLQLVGSYPVVAKSLRDIRKSGGKAVHRQHCCGMTLQEHGLGYEDLDKLLQNPQPLEFIIGNNKNNNNNDTNVSKVHSVSNETESEALAVAVKCSSVITSLSLGGAVGSAAVRAAWLW